jgi:ssDNA-binding replication factor A large subunit
MHIFRVIVRGRFADLDPIVTAVLLGELERTDELDTYTFTKDGTLTFDRRLDFWSVRVEVRVPDDATDDAKAVAFERATAIATEHLGRRGAAGRDLRITGSAMADVWRD